MSDEKKSTYDMHDAYSFARIGYVSGDAMLDAARRLGYSEDCVEQIFRSKYPRWFYDRFETRIANQVKRLFVQYLEENLGSVDKMLVEECKLQVPVHPIPKGARHGKRSTGRRTNKTA